MVSSSNITIKYLKIIQNDQQRILKNFSSGKSETTLKRDYDKNEKSEHEWMNPPQKKRRKKLIQNDTFDIKNKNKKKRNLQHLTPQCTKDEQKGMVTEKVFTPASRKVFLIPELLINIIQCLDIQQIVQLRQINHDFDNISQFTFSIQDNEMNFDYENAFIKNILERDICNSIQSLGIWYIQTVNFKNKTAPWTPEISTNNDVDIDIIGKSQCIAKIIESNKYKSVSIDNPKILKTLYSQMKHSDQKTTSKKVVISAKGISDLLLGKLYGIIPLANRLSYLINKDESFQHDICVATFTTPIVREGRIWYESGRNLTMVTDMTKISRARYFFSTQRYGFVRFFHYAALKGDFSIYLNYLSNVCGKDDKKIRKCGVSMDGIFSLMCLFLRDDLMDSYVHYDANYGMSKDTRMSVLYLVSPNILLRYQNNLKKLGIPITKNEEYEMDLINNPRYNPYNRLMAIRKLCFSSNFGLSWRWTFSSEQIKFIYTMLRRIVLQLYYNFDHFQSEWHLNEYDDFKNDIVKQKELHDQFKVIIQVLLGFSCCWYQNMDHQDERQDIIKSKVRANQSNYNITLNDEFKFIDVDPQNETELEALYNVMIQDYDDDQIIDFLEHPQTEKEFQWNVEEHKWTDVGEPLVFPHVTHPYLLFHKMWKSSHQRNDIL